MIANGCVIGEGCTIENSIVGLRTVLGNDVTIRNSIIMGADYYEDSEESTKENIPLGIGDSTIIQGSIIDKDCRIGRNVRIINETGIEDSRQDNPICVVRDGIPVVTKGSMISDNQDLAKLLS